MPRTTWPIGEGFSAKGKILRPSKCACASGSFYACALEFSSKKNVIFINSILIFHDYIFWFMVCDSISVPCNRHRDIWTVPPLWINSLIEVHQHRVLCFEVSIKHTLHVPVSTYSEANKTPHSTLVPHNSLPRGSLICPLLPYLVLSSIGLNHRMSSGAEHRELVLVR